MPGLNIATILSYVLAVAVGVLIYFVYAKLNISKANVSAQKIIDDATSKADNLVKEAILDAIIEYFKNKLAQSGSSEEDTEALIEQGPEVFFEVGSKTYIERINTPKMEQI